MASGKRHLRASSQLNTVLTLTSVTLFAYGETSISLSIMFGACLGTFITPDLDLIGKTITENMLLRVPIVGEVFYHFWLHYAAESKHRGVSHVAILGTISRAAYIILGSILLAGMFKGLTSIEIDVLFLVNVICNNLTHSLWAFLSWTSHDLVHLWLDRKKGKRRGKRN